MELLKPGQIFAGRYRVERFLAQGGMGAVFVAEQLATELTVAIKVLFPHVLASNDAIERFQLEARVAARVKSQHIVAVLDAGYDEPTQLPFLVMEMLSGESLEDKVQRAGPLSPREVVTYMAECATGLDKAHGYRDKNGRSQPIVHRDLKPENLFLSRRESGEPMIKILDFGIAKVLTDTANLSQELKGTPLFMASEQASGQAITPRTDIWALGLITFFLLTGKHYWLAANNDEAGLPALFGEVLAQPIVAPSERVRELGLGVALGRSYDAWFLRCVNRNPDARFASAGEAAVALGAALGVDVTFPESNLVADRKSGPVASAMETKPPGPHAARTQDQLALSATNRTNRSGARPVAVTVALIAAIGVIAGGYLLVGRNDPSDPLPPEQEPARSSLGSSAPAALVPEPAPALSETTGASASVASSSSTVRLDEAKPPPATRPIAPRALQVAAKKPSQEPPKAPGTKPKSDATQVPLHPRVESDVFSER